MTQYILHIHQLVLLKGQFAPKYVSLLIYSLVTFTNYNNIKKANEKCNSNNVRFMSRAVLRVAPTEVQLLVWIHRLAGFLTAFLIKASLVIFLISPRLTQHS